MNSATTENQSISRHPSKEVLPTRSLPAQSEVANLREKVLSRLKTVATKQPDVHAKVKADRIMSSLETDGVDESFAKLASGALTKSDQPKEPKQEKSQHQEPNQQKSNYAIPEEVRNDPRFQQQLGIALLKARESGNDEDIEAIEKKTLGDYIQEKEAGPAGAANEEPNKKEGGQYASGNELQETRDQHAQMMENIASLLYATAAQLNGESPEEDSQSLLELLIHLLEWLFAGILGEEETPEMTDVEAA